MVFPTFLLSINSIFLILCLAILSYYWYWKLTLLNRIPSISTVFPFGHFWYLIGEISSETTLTTNFLRFLHGLAKIFEKDGMFYLRIWPMKNIVVLCSADHAQVIFSNREEIQKSSLYATAKILIGDGLLSSNGGDSYRHHKRIISPNFQKKTMERHQTIMSHHCSVLCQKLDSTEEETPVTILDYTIPCAFDIAFQTSTGKSTGDFNANVKLTSVIKRGKDIWNDRIVNPWLQTDWFFFRYTDLGKEFTEIDRYLRYYFTKLVSERREEIKEKMAQAKASNEEYSEDVERPCVLDLLLTHQLTADSPLSDQEIRDEISTIIAAGFETSSDTLSWTFFLVGLYPEVQKKIHRELDELFREDRDREVTYKDINSLQYLQCAIKESMRLHPVLPVVARELKSDMEIGNKLIPKGTELAVLISAIHRDPKYYDNPEEFIPERFLPENAKDRHPFAFLPFAEGNRRCIGSTFALRSNSTALCYVLRRFRIESLEARDTVRTAWAIHGRPEVPVKLRLYRR